MHCTAVRHNRHALDVSDTVSRSELRGAGAVSRLCVGAAADILKGCDASNWVASASGCHTTVRLSPKRGQSWYSTSLQPERNYQQTTTHTQHSCQHSRMERDRACQHWTA